MQLYPRGKKLILPTQHTHVSLDWSYVSLSLSLTMYMCHVSYSTYHTPGICGDSLGIGHFDSCLPRTYLRPKKYNAPIKVMAHYPQSGQMWRCLTVTEPKQCPRCGDIGFCNNFLNRGVWLAGLAML